MGKAFRVAYIFGLEVDLFDFDLRNIIDPWDMAKPYATRLIDWVLPLSLPALLPHTYRHEYFGFDPTQIRHRSISCRER